MIGSRRRWSAALTLAVAALVLPAGGVLPGQPAPKTSAPKPSASKPSAPKAAPVSKAEADRAAAATAAATAAFLDAEARAAVRTVDGLRGEYLARASWAELGDRCNPGSLRVFAADTTPVQRQALQALVERMEQVILVHGVGYTLATPEARALLRVIVGWEAGIDRPRWDEDGAGVHRALATGLTGEVPDPTSAGCLPSPVQRDTVTFVVPGFTDMEFPNAARPRVKAYLGREAPQRARDEFYTAVGSRTPEAELSYIRIAPVVIWRGYALVGVDRPRERGGIEIGVGSNGGAAYLLRRVGREWRLLSIVRSRGS
ncbi:MAG: hypothetical protein P3C10_01555 [Gemmatimonadota bacterium]|nr:hypothetical protein [Gemmatimonadota bacterium]